MDSDLPPDETEPVMQGRLPTGLGQGWYPGPCSRSQDCVVLAVHTIEPEPRFRMLKVCGGMTPPRTSPRKVMPLCVNKTTGPDWVIEITTGTRVSLATRGLDRIMFPAKEPMLVGAFLGSTLKVNFTGRPGLAVSPPGG